MSSSVAGAGRPVLIGREDEKPALRRKNYLGKDPLEGLITLIGESVAQQVHPFGSPVEDLEPIGEIAVLIDNPIEVGREILIEQHLRDNRSGRHQDGQQGRGQHAQEAGRDNGSIAAIRHIT